MKREDALKGKAALMNVIRPNCRAQFTVQDMDFIQLVLDPDKRVTSCLHQLFGDTDSRDVILDSDRLYNSLLERPECVKVSSHFYFYVLVRHVFHQNGISDRNVADYVAELLAEFANSERARCPSDSTVALRPMDYLVDMLAMLEKVDDDRQFLIRTHMGNHSLFLTGIFPGQVEYRTRYKAAPKVEYYESLGSTSYRVASHHHLAREYNLTAIFEFLARCFHAIRLSLNKLAEEILCLDPDYSPLLIRV
jgi:hypothetical protein